MPLAEGKATEFAKADLIRRRGGIHRWELALAAICSGRCNLRMLGNELPTLLKGGSAPLISCDVTDRCDRRWGCAPGGDPVVPTRLSWSTVAPENRMT